MSNFHLKDFNMLKFYVNSFHYPTGFVTKRRFFMNVYIF